MEHLNKFKDPFKNQDIEIEKVVAEQKRLILEQDRQVADFLGIKYPGVVFIVKEVLEVFKWKQMEERQDRYIPAHNNSLEEERRRLALADQLRKKLHLVYRKKASQTIEYKKLKNRLEKY
ncbi:2827_t:CDS:1 [Gigaspora margarita]|uniref:2827_t:CDS:1 n=1 Tax=Gigaspora margarita TaxID=4874 RepID=A0ABN7V7Y0_GIGMA|nr:2827_t:CDS:1 [Gigaspora margarita]